MILLDAYAVLAFLRDEPAAEPVGALLSGDEALGIATANTAEVVDQLIRVHGADPDRAIADLNTFGLRGVELDSDVAYRAGRLRARHYHRTDRPVSLGDCIAAATALSTEDCTALASSDPPLLTMVHDEGGGTAALPASDGTTWTPPTAPRIM